jgi:hypothetical protein
VWTLFLASVLVATALLRAQKAEPVRILFDPVSKTATVCGRLRGRQQMEYVAPARSRQVLHLHLNGNPLRSLALKVYDPDGTEVALKAARPGQQWTTVVPRDGDYGIAVIRTSRQPGTSTYTLRVRLRGPD